MVFAGTINLSWSDPTRLLEKSFPLLWRQFNQ